MLVGSIILAGGRSLRMGRPKEMLQLPGGPMLAHLAGALARIAPRVVVVARGADQELPALPAGAEVVFDERPDAGPLPALAQGLRTLAAPGRAPDAFAFATACDAPFVSPAVVQLLADRMGRAACAMVRAEGRAHPLCALYRLDVAATIEAMLREGIDAPRRLPERVETAFVDETALRAVDADLACLLPCNTEAEFEAVMRRLGGARP